MDEIARRFLELTPRVESALVREELLCRVRKRAVAFASTSLVLERCITNLG